MGGLSGSFVPAEEQLKEGVFEDEPMLEHECFKIELSPKGTCLVSELSLGDVLNYT